MDRIVVTQKTCTCKKGVETKLIKIRLLVKKLTTIRREATRIK